MKGLMSLVGVEQQVTLEANYGIPFCPCPRIGHDRDCTELESLIADGAAVSDSLPTLTTRTKLIRGKSGKEALSPADQQQSQVWSNRERCPVSPPHCLQRELFRRRIAMLL